MEQVRVYGMSPTVGLVSFPDIKDREKSPFSKALKNLIDMEAKKLIAKAYYRTEELLRQNQDKLKIVSTAFFIFILISRCISLIAEYAE